MLWYFLEWSITIITENWLQNFKKGYIGKGKNITYLQLYTSHHYISLQSKTAGPIAESGLLYNDFSSIFIEFRSDDVINMKFVKLWDLLWYSERTTSKTPTRQKLAIRGRLSSKSYLVPNLVNRTKFRRICVESSQHNWANISETIGPELLILASRRLKRCSFRTS